MDVTLFASVSSKYNPYITLLQQAVQPYCEAPVAVQPRFSPGWVLRHGKAGSIAHIHWIESHLRPHSPSNPTVLGCHRLINKLENNRVSQPMWATGLLAKLAVAVALALRADVRMVYTVHNLVPHRRRSAYMASLGHLANRLMFTYADAVHMHSHYTAEAVAQSYGRTHRVFVVPLGNYMSWYPNTISRAEARLRLNLPDDAFVYLFLGQIAPYKGLEDLVEAFLGLDDPTTWLLIAGRLVRDYGTHFATMTQHPRVVYQPGFVPDDEVQVYANAADAAVLPYRHITTSASALLAFSFGRPVVAPALGALSEIVPSCAGVSYDPEEPGALIAALRRARHISWSSQAIVAHARQFDWQVIGARIADVYRAALTAVEAPSASRGG